MKPETKLKRILAKKRLTGKDLGETLLLDIAINLDRREKGQPPKPPTFTPEDIDQIAESLTDKEKLEYNLYVSLHNAIAKGAKNEALYASQFFHAYYKLQGYLTDILDYEERYAEVGSHPLIVSKPAFDELRQRAIAARANRMINYADLLFYTAEYFVMCEKQPLLLPPSIREELESLKETPFTSGPTKAAPAPAEPLKPAKEEWEKSIDAAKLLYEGKDAIIAHLDKVNYNTEPLKEMTENELIDYIGELGAHSFLTDTAAILKNRAAQTMPETMHGLLEKHIRAYKAAKETSVKRSRLKAFKTEFKALYKAIDAYMCMQIPELAGLKANQQLKPLFKASDLAGVKANYDPIKVMLLAADLTNSDIADLFNDTTPAEYLKKAQISNGGISITSCIVPSARPRFDESGIYTADINKLNSACIDTLKDSDSDTLDDILFQQEWLKSPIRNMYAYNAYLKAAFSGLNIDYLDIAYIGMNLIETNQRYYNSAVYLAFSGVVGTPGERAESRAAIRRAFKPLDLESLQPSQELEDHLLNTVQTLKKDKQLIAFYQDFEGITEQILDLMNNKGAGLNE